MGSIGNIYTIMHLNKDGHSNYVKSNLAQAQTDSLPMLSEIGGIPDGMQIGIIAAKYDEFGMIRDDTYNYPTSTNCFRIIQMVDAGFSDPGVSMCTWYTANGKTEVNPANGQTVNITAAMS